MARGVGPESEAESVGSRGRRWQQAAGKSNTGFFGVLVTRNPKKLPPEKDATGWRYPREGVLSLVDKKRAFLPALSTWALAAPAGM